jgi:endonuclease/exonuclease/phosphatase family metal-dependent hydrolase
MRIFLICLFRLAISVFVGLWGIYVLAQEVESASSKKLRVMTWNTWHGGREDGEDVGPQRVVEVIRDSQADIVALQETYGSGEWIAEQLGFHFHPRGTNVSILSRFPIVEDLSVHQEFKNVGAIVELPSGRRIACYSIWLPYGKEIWEPGTRDNQDLPGLLTACQPSADDLDSMLKQIVERLSDSSYAKIPLIIAGDFNAMSHLDYSEIGFHQYGVVADWHTTKVLLDQGFRDSYREMNPTPDRMRDRTWTPRFPEQEQDRIDYIFYQGDLLALNSRTIDTHPVQFPSDHAAVLTTFTMRESAERSVDDFAFEGKLVSYNIRHGRGMDNEVDLTRIAEVIRKSSPDFVALQEVDDGVRRSGTVNQTRELSRLLGMHPAFGKFMNHDGGRYGMAILSKHPLIRIESVVLPQGGEPRIALAVEVLLPNNERLTVVNVHFDWLKNDKDRFAQAEKLGTYLKELKTPYLLVGDFNDRPGSRTLDLFSQGTVEAFKPRDQRATFPADAPTVEIDFIFGGPNNRWSFSETEVIDEQVASDHRPVRTTFQLKKAD